MMYDPEKETLINRLSAIYPYPRHWFEGKTTAQLIAMYNLPAKSKKHHAAVLNKKEPKDSPHKYYDDESGIWMVKTDGHGWEPEEK